MKHNKVFLGSVVVALGGFLLGFDMAVISGAEQSIQKDWFFNAFEHGVTISIALIGTLIGLFLSANPYNLLGSKGTLYITNPIYISEIAPAERCGRLVALFLLNVVFGILISYLTNYLQRQIGENSCRLMLSIQVVPSFLFLVLLRLIPQKTRWLLLKTGRIEDGRNVLQIINPETADATIKTIGQVVADADVMMKIKIISPVIGCGKILRLLLLRMQLPAQLLLTVNIAFQYLKYNAVSLAFANASTISSSKLNDRAPP